MAEVVQSSKSDIKKYSYIDVLRGLAILGVIAVHANERKIKGINDVLSSVLNYGQLGVQLFFVASALTLCLSMSERKEHSLSGFYLRRLFRIAPLYYFGVVLYAAAALVKHYYFLGVWQIPEQYSILNILLNVLFLHGFYPPANNTIVPGGWSIATEMAFYSTFPFLYATQLKMNNKQYIAFSIIVSMGCGVLTYLIHHVWQSSPSYIPGFIYFSLLNQLNVFLIGIYTFRVLNSMRVGVYGVIVGILFTLISCYLLNSTYDFKFNRFLFPILSSISFMLLALKLKQAEVDLSSWYVWGVLKRVGQLSFSIYIIHFLVLDLMVLLLEKSIFQYLDSPDLKVLILFLIATFLSFQLSKITNKYIENYWISVGKKCLTRRLKFASE